MIYALFSQITSHDRLVRLQNTISTVLLFFHRNQIRYRSRRHFSNLNRGGTEQYLLSTNLELLVGHNLDVKSRSRGHGEKGRAQSSNLCSPCPFYWNVWEWKCLFLWNRTEIPFLSGQTKSCQTKWKLIALKIKVIKSHPSKQ